MSKKIELLDCTLRDGGYVNDWNFGHSVITGTYRRLQASGVEYIEVGFIDDRRKFDINRSIVPDTDGFNTIFEGVEKKKGVIPLAMIDYGTCNINNIKDCSDSFIDGIRMIFKKEKIDQALPYCKEIKKKGYKLFIQAISITAYSDKELLGYIEKINKIKPYAFSIVDTYGLLDSRKLTHYFNVINNNLDKDIVIGYHAHNNFQLAFSNSIKFLALETKRTLVVDSTVYGMGKSAGNCASELVAMHMNQRYDKEYDINQFLEIFDTDLTTVYQKQYWGYKYNFYISAMQECHPNYVQALLDKKTLSVSSINAILSGIPEDKKLLYDAAYIENAYLEYQYNEIEDEAAVNSLADIMKNKTIILIAPGKSILTEQKKIEEFISQNEALAIGVNFDSEILGCDLIFISNAKRYSKMADMSNKNQSQKEFIITSNITPYAVQPEYILNYSALIKENGCQNDNALLLCLALLKRTGIKSVTLAGFDGFSEGHDEYYSDEYLFAGNEEYKIQNTIKVKNALKNFSEFMEIHFLTDSLYEQEESDEN